MTRPKLLLCTGSHCRKALTKHGLLQQTVSALPVEVTRVGCQKICRGPVVGVRIDGRWEWFEKMGSRKAVDALAELVERNTLRKRLDKRRSRKRSGRVRP